MDRRRSGHGLGAPTIPIPLMERSRANGRRRSGGRTPTGLTSRGRTCHRRGGNLSTRMKLRTRIGCFSITPAPERTFTTRFRYHKVSWAPGKIRRKAKEHIKAHHKAPSEHYFKALEGGTKTVEEKRAVRMEKNRTRKERQRVRAKAPEMVRARAEKTYKARYPVPVRGETRVVEPDWPKWMVSCQMPTDKAVRAVAEFTNAGEFRRMFHSDRVAALKREGIHSQDLEDCFNAATREINNAFPTMPPSVAEEERRGTGIPSSTRNCPGQWSRCSSSSTESSPILDEGGKKQFCDTAVENVRTKLFLTKANRREGEESTRYLYRGGGLLAGWLK